MDDELKKNLLVKWVGNLEVNAESDVFNGEILDTTIKIQGGLLCVVAGNERVKFLEELNEVVSKYRI